MPEGKVAVKCQPGGKTILVPAGAKILHAAARAGVLIDTPCGGHGTCGKCKVRVVDNATEATETEQNLLSPAEIEAGIRLACQACVDRPCTIEVPDESLLLSPHQILGGGSVHAAADVSDVAVRKHFVELPGPSRGDSIPDLERLQRSIGLFELDIDLLRDLPQRLRAGNWRGTAVLHNGRLIDFETGDTSAECYAVAFDIGTTTLVGVLLDLGTGRECGTSSRLNPQTRFGDDVLSRIQHVSQHPEGLGQLQQAIVGEVNAMIRELAQNAAVPIERIYEAAFAGNTTMLHLFNGIDPRALGEVPFTPAFSHGLRIPTADVGLAVHPRGQAYVFPVTGGFVGGDTVACILATDLAQAEEPTVLVDIGTNGEIVVSHAGRLLAASTAAGPAFEGARISDGMRAAAGAIEHVMLEDDVRIEVIGDGPPAGLCGSALIDLVAELLRCGIITPQGLLLDPSHVAEDIPPAIRARITGDDDGPAFVVAPGEMTKTAEPIRFTQRDVREFQLAAGAIRAGVTILLRQVGLAPSDVARVLIAGGFGNYIHRSNAQRIGLLPTEVPPTRIAYVGNASLAGARLAVTSRKARERAERLARTTQHVDLSLDADFQTAFAMAMQFPDSP